MKTTFFISCLLFFNKVFSFIILQKFCYALVEIMDVCFVKLYMYYLGMKEYRKERKSKDKYMEKTLKKRHVLQE